MTWEGWLIAISVAIIAIAFVVLVVYLVLTLIGVRQAVKDIDDKIRTFDPLFRVVNKAGCAIEKKAARIKQFADEVEEEAEYELRSRKEGAVNTAMEVAEWAMIGMALWQKIREKKWK